MTDWDVSLVTQASLSGARDTREFVRAAIDVLWGGILL